MNALEVAKEQNIDFLRTKKKKKKNAANKSGRKSVTEEQFLQENIKVN